MTEDQIAAILTGLGCPAEKSRPMAAQLLKRAQQLAEQKNRPIEEALAHLLKIVVESGGFPKD